MLKSIYIKTEFKKMFREPMMTMMFLAPIIIPIIFRLLVNLLVPIISKYSSFDIADYEHYILSFTLILSPMFLSIIMGFTMIDDKDNKIVELMSITPLGRSGYIGLRLALVFLFVIPYTIYAYFVLGIYIIPLYTLLYLSLILCAYSSIMGMLLFSVSADKVIGLTYAKGLNIIALFAFADLLNIKWLNILGGFFPTYWITQIVSNPHDLFSLAMGGFVTVVWFVIFLLYTKY